MADKLELEISLVGLERAIAEVSKLGDAAQKQIDNLSTRGNVGSGARGGSGGGGYVRIGGQRVPISSLPPQVQSLLGSSGSGTTSSAAWERNWTTMVRNDIRARNRVELRGMEEKEREAKNLQRIADRYVMRDIRASNRVKLKEIREQEKNERDIRDKQERIRRDRVAYLKDQGNTILSSVGRAATWAGAGVAGAAAYGAHNTVEGNRLHSEVAALSRELASAFRPLIGALTNLTRSARTTLEQLSPREQSQLASTLEIGIAGYLLRKPIGAAGRVAALGLGAAGRGVMGAYAAGGASAVAGLGATGLAAAGAAFGLYKGYLGYDAMRNGQELSSGRSLKTGMAENEMGRLGYRWSDGSHANTLKSINAEAAKLRANQTNIDSHFANRSNWDLRVSNLFGSDPGSGDLAKAQNDLNRRMEALVQKRKFLRNGGETPDGPNADRMRLKDASTVGFGNVGSTAELMQETISKTGGGEEPQESQMDLLSQILIAIKDLKQSPAESDKIQFVQKTDG